MDEPSKSTPATQHRHGEEWLRSPLLRKAVKVALDTLAAALAFTAASSMLLQGIHFDRGMAAFVLLAMAINLGFRFHIQHYRMVDIQEVKSLMKGTLALAMATLTIGIIRGGWSTHVRPAVLLTASLLTGFLWATIRLAVLALHQRLPSGKPAVEGKQLYERTLIVGAGRAGVKLCQELQEHPRLRCKVLGFIDDDLEKQGLCIHGIPVLGPTLLLPVFIREQKVTQVILGMAAVRGELLKQLSRVVLAEGVRLKTVPGIMDLMGDRPWKPEVRDVAIEDLLRRDPVILDTDPIQQALSGQVVLITGAGGSIGSELARRVASLGPKLLVLLGRGENSLWEVQRKLAGHYPEQAMEIVLGDIRNPDRLHQIFQKWKPKIVLHAAAHKHVPFLEANPEEAIENNIFGTRNVVAAARECGTRIFVNVSTDKAVNPVSVLGVSKAIGEILVARAAREVPRAKFISVRFGNVLGSRGSVIPLFREQIKAGGPVTVTHPDMVRYFMTIPEAAQLVLQAGILGESGKVFALDMGDPVHIVRLAEEMVRLSGFAIGTDVSIRFTGVRPGEKLVEELFAGVKQRTTVHPKIFEAEELQVEPAELDRRLRTLREIQTDWEMERYAELVRCFQGLVPTFRPSPQGLGRHLEEAAAPIFELPKTPSGSLEFRIPLPARLRAVT